LEYRIGVNLGDVIEEGERIRGGPHRLDRGR
jgi:hypothetical protein